MKYSPAGKDGGPSYEGDQSTFSGRAVLGRFLSGSRSGKVQVGTVTVTFEPGSRTYWHSHDDGQVLIASDGRGVVENRDGDRHLLHPGDIVYAPPGEVHWHGATPGASLVQTAVSLGEARWEEEVPEAHYQAIFKDVDE
jgi:quercetin dioxygenase-like cupin family protein